MDVKNLISGSSAFSKSILYIWKFLVHVLLKPSLKDFEHNLACVWNEHNCTVVWTFFSIALLWSNSESWSFPSCGHCSVFWIHWHTECDTSARETVTYCPLALLSCPLWQLFYRAWCWIPKDGGIIVLWRWYQNACYVALLELFEVWLIIKKMFSS